MEKAHDTQGEGHAVQIVRANKDRTFTLDEEALARVLHQDHCKNKPVAIISVTGALRTGKSFLLNFILRYLKKQARVSLFVITRLTVSVC